MAVTILQIAERLQLSHSTVSRVLNNKPNAYIAEETRRRVQAVAQEMGYRPNLAARSLRDARSNMVGIFASPHVGIWSGGGLEVTNALAEVLHERDLHAFFALVAEDGTEQKGLPVWRFDGAVLLQRPPQATIQYLFSVDRPFVAINEWVKEGVSVLADESDGVRQAMDHLWELGHRAIAYAGPTRWHFEHYSVSERHQGYLSYLAERGVAPVPGHDQVPSPEVPSDHHNPDVRLDWVRRTVLDGGATAILAYDHFVLLEVLSAAQRLLLRVPHDLSVVCFNDDVVTAKLNPPITVVATPTAAMGRTAGEVLLERMDAGEGASPRSESLPTLVRILERLIVRESTAPPIRRTVPHPR